MVDGATGESFAATSRVLARWLDGAVGVGADGVRERGRPRRLAAAEWCVGRFVSTTATATRGRDRHEQHERRGGA